MPTVRRAALFPLRHNSEGAGLRGCADRMENGKMYNGLLTVAYQLQDVDPEQGGL